MKYKIKGLDCANCALKVEKYIRESSLVKEVSISFPTQTIMVEFSKNSKDNLEKLNKLAHEKEKSVEIIEFNKSDVEFEEDYKKLDTIKKNIYITSILFVVGLILEFFMEKYLKYKGLRFYYIHLYVVSYFLIAFPIIKEAFVLIRKKDFFNEKVLMAVATIAAYSIREYEEATGVMLFYTIGEFFQEISVLKSRKSIKNLIETTENRVNAVKNETIENISVTDVKKGDKIYIKPGEKILFDGMITAGSTELDTAIITGESMPRNFKENDEIKAGMINIVSPIIVEVSSLFDESSIFKIVEIVENSSHKKSNMEKMITKFARIYTPVVFSLSLLITILPPIFFKNISIYDSIYNGIVFLVISCPCALVLSIPLTFFSGIARAASMGILIKGANIFDNIYKSKRVFLDKTGTITEGKFRVSSVYENLENTTLTSKEIYEYVYKVENESNHPIAKSIINFISNKYNLVDNAKAEEYKLYLSICEHCGCCHDVHDHEKGNVVIRDHENTGHFEGDMCSDNHNHSHDLENNIKIEDFAKNLKIWSLKEIAGLGIEAEISGKKVLIGKKELFEKNGIEIPKNKIHEDTDKSSCIISIDGQFVMSFIIEDNIKKDTKMALKNMKKYGIKEIVMLTGDNEIIAKKVSEELEIDRYYASLLPEDKLEIVRKEQKNGEIMYIGDGINDAPVISLSDVGIAMGKMGQDITIESADVVFNTDSLTKVSELIILSNKMKKIIIQNLSIILFIKLLVMILGMFNFMSMWFAVFADVGVSIIAVLNAIRIKNIKIKI